MIGDLLYRLTGRDEQVTQLDVVYESVSESIAAASIGRRWGLSNSQAFYLTNVQVGAIAGGAQTITSWSLAIFNPQDALAVQLDSVASLAVTTANFRYAPSGPGVIVFPGHRINVTVGFSAGAVANLAQIGLTGILIPRGSLTLGQLTRLL